MTDMMAELTITPSQLRDDRSPPDLPLAFIEFGASEGPDDVVLPPYPVIGIGDRAQPLAAMLDAVIEPPVTAARIVAQVLAAPLAAAAAVRLLRDLPAMTPAAGLVAESATYALLQGSAEHARWLAGRSGADAGERPPGGVDLTRDGDTLYVTLDRVAAGNAIDRPMRDAVYEAFALAALDSEITRVLLGAHGKAFSLGADLAEFGTTTDPATAHAIRAQTLPALQAIRIADRLDAHIDGACIGAGLELAAFAQRITATPRAWFQLPELAMGVIPGAGGCVSLNRRIGRQRTALMILSGQRLSARDALGWGLVDEIVDQPA